MSNTDPAQPPNGRTHAQNGPGPEYQPHPPYGPGYGDPRQGPGPGYDPGMYDQGVYNPRMYDQGVYDPGMYDPRMYDQGMSGSGIPGPGPGPGYENPVHAPGSAHGNPANDYGPGQFGYGYPANAPGPGYDYLSNPPAPGYDHPANAPGYEYHSNTQGPGYGYPQYSHGAGGEPPVGGPAAGYAHPVNGPGQAARQETPPYRPGPDSAADGPAPGSQRSADGTVARRAAFVIQPLADVAAGFLVLWILLYALDANQTNPFVEFVRDLAGWLGGWAQSIFTMDNDVVRVVLNHGLPAVVYVAVGHGTAGWLRRV